MPNVREIVESGICEQATGCSGAGDFREFARQQGFDRCEVLDWTSSAGDWTFIVSRNGYEWHIMSQTNDYPYVGFTRTIDESETFFGDPVLVFEEIEARYA